MTNVTIFNGAYAGAIEGITSGRNSTDPVAVDYLNLTNIAAAIAGAVDSAISATSTTAKEADAVNAITAGYYSGRSPSSTTAGTYAADALAIKALWTEAILLLH